jgi:hypothetical protein
LVCEREKEARGEGGKGERGKGRRKGNVNEGGRKRKEDNLK